MNNDVIKVQLSCGVDYYKGDKGDKPIKGVDYFTQEDIADIVEQIETGGVDLDGYATKEYVDNAVSGVVVSETDPTVPEWAKQATKPTYTANEVGALPADTVLFSGSYNDLTDKPTIPEVPVNVSAFNNDAGYLTNVEFHDTTNNTSVSVNDVGLYVETINNDEQNTVYRTDVINMGVQTNGPSGGVAMGNRQLMFVEPTNGNMLTVSINENADSLYVNGDKVALVNDIPNLTDYATKSYVDTAIANIDIPAPIVIQATLAGQPTVDNNGNYNVTLAITSNNMAEAYEQYQTNPSTVGISVDLTAMGIPSKMYMDCENFYKRGNSQDGYYYETYGEFNDGSLSYQFGFEFHNVNIYLSSQGGSSGTLTGIATVHQLASKANSADLATVATSGDYNDLTNKPTIPTAYTLPTATTSTLGGVKVDGTTITITDGVISATSSGTTYTAGQGIVIDNGEISVDFGNEIENGSFSFTQHYDNEDFYKYTSYMYPDEINITSYGEADPETGDQETKGILITGEGITFDDIGDTHTLGVSNGKLVFDDSPIGSGGGTTYTAGDGINIDSNGVISQNFSQLGILHILPHFDVPNSTSWRTTLQALADSLNNTGYGIVDASALYGFTPAQLNEALGNKQYDIVCINDMNYSNSNPENITNYNYNSTATLFSRSARDMYYFIITPIKIYYSKSSQVLLRYLWYGVSTGYITVSTNGAVNYTDYRLPFVIKQLDTAISSKQDAIIPSAPTTDGNYVLKVSVSSGTPTYSWVAE